MKSPTSHASGSRGDARRDTNLQPGDFTRLASDYAKYRPDYSSTVLEALLAIVGKPREAIDAVDVGAGTGIWTRMLASSGLRSVTGIEPNDQMRQQAIDSDRQEQIRWLTGSAEATGLDAHSADILTMASSFHWAHFESAMEEFKRVLRPGGRFVAVWNPRRVDHDPLFVAVEQALAELGPEIRRVSSGRSGITETLTNRLSALRDFEDVCYFEGRHTVVMTRERYLGAWRSVNDIRVQLGEARFEEFLRRVEELLGQREEVEASYITRAWTAKSRPN